MCSMSAKPTIKRELMEVDDDVVEILPRRAVAPNGSGFAVKIRDTNELTEADIRFIKPFLKVRISILQFHFPDAFFPKI